MIPLRSEKAVRVRTLSKVGVDQFAVEVNEENGLHFPPFDYKWRKLSDVLIKRILP